MTVKTTITTLQKKQHNYCSESEKKPRKLNSLANARAKIFFLGYQTTETKLIYILIDNECEVWHTSSPISSTVGFDFVISFGYRHILKNNIINSSSAPIINLHISYLPYNRGAHPNFWSFFEGTPSGVSIHLIDGGIDTGPILFQRYANFPKTAITFKQTYNFLIELIEELFIENIRSIITNSYSINKQKNKGTYHCIANLPKRFIGWRSVIKDEIERLKQKNLS